jgi:hypothetical protein
MLREGAMRSSSSSRAAGRLLVGRPTAGYLLMMTVGRRCRKMELTMWR